MNIAAMVRRLDPVLRGWISYFRAANCVVGDPMGWIRRWLRMKQMREWKSGKPSKRTA